ncbi:GGDEF domain-containing protein [Devosia sp. Leaf64]|uniref:GGDEF domain-containing protein n=1 Tax=Devosia sp. Leaf64 TaxID=1736229 RepID=UPI0007154DFE|nr:GGDEF domain-containing protein [Devosia sp. Leaf64]KQN73765.1 hypothetical protein ASE94_05810 [Devosia sp. Leaf64]
MSAASIVLAINLCVGAIFVSAFGFIAVYRRSAVGARWQALAYSMTFVIGLLEYSMPYQTNAQAAAYGSFAAFLTAMLLSNIGLARHYEVRVPWLSLGLLFALALGINLFTLGMPRDSLARGLIYQAPYALMHVIGIQIILANRSRRMLDLTLVSLFALSALTFLGKPFLALAIGSGGSVQGYLSSNYAAISQASGGVLIIANGLLILLIMTRDVIADMTTLSETDPLSGLLNRRGFDEQAERARLMAQRAGMPAVAITADIDHFKQINDTYGHDRGDQVIAMFGELLKESFDQRAVVARMGGEEFAVLLPGAGLTVARGAAEAARLRLRDLPKEIRGTDKRITCSFGIAVLDEGESLSNLLRRADMALYDAKAKGRDRVSIAPAPSLDSNTPQGAASAEKLSSAPHAEPVRTRLSG